MEENNRNNGFIFKVLAAILIAILCINTYRTEVNRKALASLSGRVDEIDGRTPAVDLIEKPAPAAAEQTDGKPDGRSEKATGQNQKEIASLKQTVKALQSRIETLQGKVETVQADVNRLSKGVTKKTMTTTAASEKTEDKAPAASGKVSVSAKVKVENRYVNGKTPLPQVTDGPVGVVVIGLTIDQIGIVGKVSVESGTTIDDEEIIDLCKEAALKTNFAYNPEAPDKSTGTITYTFKAK